jgi:hypothetical protein
MVHAVAPFRPPARNENLAIITFHPLSGNPLDFVVVRELLRDFLQLEKRVPFLDIQPTHLGQAMVRLTHTYTRDELVQNSPHMFDNVSVTFTMTRVGTGEELNSTMSVDSYCWVFLNDYWFVRHVQHAVGGFARVLLMEADDRFKARLLVQARVKDVQKVPQFIVFEDPDTIDGDSWTI